MWDLENITSVGPYTVRLNIWNISYDYSLWNEIYSSLLHWQVSLHNRASLVAQTVEICLQRKRPGFKPWFRKIPWGKNDNTLQYSCLKNSMDRGASRLKSLGSQRVGRNWANNTYLLYNKHIEKYPLGSGNFYYQRSAKYQKWTSLNMMHTWLVRRKEEDIWMNNKAKQIANYIFISYNLIFWPSAKLLITLL